MADRQLRHDLLRHLGITRQALSKRAKGIKRSYGPMTTDEAVYVIAHMEGVDLARYLPLAVLDRVRSLVPRTSFIESTARPKVVAKRRSKPVSSRRYPLVSKSLSAQSHKLGEEVFPVLFELENSIRSLIEITLSKSGANWWSARTPLAVKNNVQGTMDKEKRYPYRDRRGTHPLYYCNFDDLKKIIIEPANQADFQSIIYDFSWFKVKMDEIYMARNNIAHCVPLSRDDISRIMLFHRDWARVLDSAGIK